MERSIRRHVAVLGTMIVFAAAFFGCGSSESSGGGGGGERAAAGCLSPSEVREEINRVAEGAESSSEEVEAKQEAIRAVEAEGC